MRSVFFEDRHDAGRRLAVILRDRKLRNPIVLGLPRGGVPVAYEVAGALAAPLDVVVVRKLGVPWQPELAIGAIASGGVRILNEEVVSGLPGLDDSVIDGIAATELEELERRELLYRGDKPMPNLRGRDAILIDDGLATGATMRAAIEAVRSQQPSRIIVAIPVGSAETVRSIRKIVDDVICLTTPAFFYAVGQSYRNFNQTTDEEVRRLLELARKEGVSSQGLSSPS
jgi:predicted phosphoribosyltransferase